MRIELDSWGITVESGVLDMYVHWALVFFGVAAYIGVIVGKEMWTDFRLRREEKAWRAARVVGDWDED